MVFGTCDGRSVGGAVVGGVDETILSGYTGAGSSGNGEVSSTIIYLVMFLVIVGLGAGGSCVARSKSVAILLYTFVMSDP